QGWAVLENLSGQDWRDVELTLVSGNPVTFRQALYRAYFVDRPEVPVEVLGRVLPNLDRGSLPAPEEALRPAPTAVPAPAPAMAPPPPGGAMRKAAPSAQALMEQMAAPPQAGGAVPVESAEAATQVTFRFGQKVSVQAGQSFVVPVVDRDVPAERLALYQPGTQPLHPLAATRLVNDGATGLPPGVLTLYERGTDGAVGFVGDARMGVVERGESRLLSFAVDTRTRIDREEGRTLRHTQAVASQGVMILTRMESQSFTHRLKAPQGEARRVVLEVPRWEGWTLRLPAGMTAELAPDAHRVTVDLAPGESREVVLTLERPEEEAIGLGDLGAPDIQAYAESDELPQAARDALMRLAELRRDVEARRRDLTALEGRRAILYAEQERLRQNLAAAPGESDLHRRYLAKLGEQETEIETVQRDAQAAQTALAEAEAAFERGVAALRF
ncbi:MAG TPA: hypothetical protein VEH84_13500, partial [Alphaproteobacteria bacterium]|nr:hypothetical protein [Alphaproteobacteria bacterium]